MGLLEGFENDEAIPSSLPPQANAPMTLPQSILFKFCERVAIRLNIKWPALQRVTNQERDIYDGKLLTPSQPKKTAPPSPLRMCQAH